MHEWGVVALRIDGRDGEAAETRFEQLAQRRMQRLLLGLRSPDDACSASG